MVSLFTLGGPHLAAVVPSIRSHRFTLVDEVVKTRGAEFVVTSTAAAIRAYGPQPASHYNEQNNEQTHIHTKHKVEHPKQRFYQQKELVVLVFTAQVAMKLIVTCLSARSFMLHSPRLTMKLLVQKVAQQAHSPWRLRAKRG